MMKSGGNVGNQKKIKSPKSSSQLPSLDHSQKEDENIRLSAAIQNKFDETFATAIKNEFFTAEKLNDLSIKDIAYLTKTIVTLCQHNETSKRKIKTTLVELAHPGIYLEKKLEEMGDKELIQELQEKDNKTKKKQAELNAEIRALRLQLELQDETEPVKSKSHGKWVEFAERHKRSTDDANGQSTSDNSKKAKLDSTGEEEALSDEEEALDDSADHQQEPKKIMRA